MYCALLTVCRRNSLSLLCFFDYGLSVTEGESIQTIQQLADALRSRGLALPAIFTLELCKPLTGCLRELYGASEAMQGLIFGRELLPALKHLLASSERVEELITILEKQPGRDLRNV